MPEHVDVTKLDPVTLAKHLACPDGDVGIAVLANLNKPMPARTPRRAQNLRSKRRTDSLRLAPATGTRWLVCSELYLMSATRG
jgi:hypothetical protein